MGLEVIDEESDDEDEQEKENGKEEHDSSLATPAPLGNRFQILHAHAHGGIGVVSVAFDSQLQREVALKQINVDHADDPDSRARFLLEAEVTGRLEHPGIVPVYGLGFDDQGRPYYAMRFVRGITLDEAIARFHRADARHDQDTPEQTLELRRLLERFVSVCHTMAYAHSRGVLHRDLKPSNVLLGPYNETLIVDWGLAKLLPRGDEVTALARRRARRSDPAQRRGAQADHTALGALRLNRARGHNGVWNAGLHEPGASRRACPTGLARQATSTAWERCSMPCSAAALPSSSSGAMSPSCSRG